MKKPLTLSIVIPAYNESIHLEGCLDAIADQEVMPNEVIVVDNNSSDSTAEIAKSYPFVTLITERKQGIVYARNSGFNAAKSDIIARIDADSIVPVNWVKTIVNFYENDKHKNYAWTSEGFFHNVRFPKVNSWILTQIAFRFNRLLLGHYALWGSTMALPRSKWLEVKRQVCHRNDIHEDLDIAIHLHKLGTQITYDTSVKVAVLMRRVDGDKAKLWQYLLLWPQTLKVHSMKMWRLGWVGAAILFTLSPILLIEKQIEKIKYKAQLIKKFYTP